MCRIHRRLARNVTITHTALEFSGRRGRKRLCSGFYQTQLDGLQLERLDRTSVQQEAFKESENTGDFRHTKIFDIKRELKKSPVANHNCHHGPELEEWFEGANVAVDSPRDIQTDGSCPEALPLRLSHKLASYVR